MDVEQPAGEAMMNAMSVKLIIGVCVLACLMSGCAASGLFDMMAAHRQYIDDLPIPQARPALVKGFVKLTQVKDVRRFEDTASTGAMDVMPITASHQWAEIEIPVRVAPRDPSVPSLQQSEKLYNDGSIRSRAIGRQSDGLQVAGDILLPKGRTVEQVMREAVTRALSERGYSVVDEKSPHFGKALPLQVEVQQFWTWWRTGGFLKSAQTEAVLILKGDAVIGSGEERVRGYAKSYNPGQVTRLGIVDLIENIKAKIKPPD